MYRFALAGTRLLAVGMFAVALVACAGAGGSPGAGGPGGPPGAGVIRGVTFDLSDAVLLHVGASSAVSTAEVGGELIKVTTSGEAVPALVEGDVEVLEFFVRNGSVYVLLAPDSAEAVGCLLGEIDGEGAMRCVDRDMASIDVTSLQFDAAGGIYYRGVADGRDVIRRSRDGVALDYHVAPGWVGIEQFVVTRAGEVYVSQVSGQLARQYSIERLADPAAGIVGRVLTVFSAPLPIYDFLPDGSLLVSRGFGDEMFPWRLHVDGEPRWDDRRFVDTEERDFERSPRFVFDHRVFADVAGRSHRSDDVMVGVTHLGVVRLYPDVQLLSLPIDMVTNAAIGSGYAAVAGSRGLHKAALWVDLATGAYQDMLDGRELDVLALRIDLEAQQVAMFARDVATNAAVLATYELELGTLSIVPADAPIDGAFEVLDLTVGHVPPAVLDAPPTPAFRTSVVADVLHGSTIAFDAAASPRAGYVERAVWRFGDGSALEVDTGYAPDEVGRLHASRVVGLQAEHAYQGPGTVSVRLDVIDEHGRTGVVEGLVEVPFIAVVRVFAEGYASYALREDGTVWSWGQGSPGQLGHGDYDDRALPWRVAALDDVRELSVGYGHVLALTRDGSVWVWGTNAQGQLGDGTRDAGLAPRRSAGLPDGVPVTAVAAGGHFSLALVSGEVWGWGYNSFGGTGSPNPGDQLVPRRVDGLPGDIVAIAAGGESSYAQAQNGDLWVWGYNGYGNLGIEQVVGHVPSRVPVHPGFRLTAGAFAPNVNHVVALDAVDAALSFGWNGFGQLGIPAELEQTWVPVAVEGLDATPMASLASGVHRSGAVSSDGRAWLWGKNDQSQIGDGTYANRFVPVQVAPDLDARAVALGDEHNLLLLRDGRVVAWGRNDFGQVGDGSREPRDSPVPLR